MPWTYTMPDGRQIHVTTFGTKVRWAILAGFGYGEITGISNKESGGRLRALLAWRDSTNARAIPVEALAAAEREAA